MKLLIIEDNAKIANHLRTGLSDVGHSVRICNNGLEGKRTAETGAFDAIVLDIGLPGCDGLHLCRELRRQGVATPLLMLSVLSGIRDKVRGLSCGADDYMTKPFDFDELVARLAALQRRRQFNDNSSLLKCGSLSMDLSQRLVKRGRRVIHLTRREFDLLALMMRHPQRVFSRQAMATAVWERHFDSGSNVIDVHIHMLRRKINVGDDPELIHTITGTGYVLDSCQGESAEQLDD